MAVSASRVSLVSLVSRRSSGDQLALNGFVRDAPGHLAGGITFFGGVSDSPAMTGFPRLG